jgi:hypothetical protein
VTMMAGNWAQSLEGLYIVIYFNAGQDTRAKLSEKMCRTLSLPSPAKLTSRMSRRASGVGLPSLSGDFQTLRVRDSSRC